MESKGSDYKLYNRNYIPPPFGLYNTGVICWFNSILQVLLSCTSLNETLLERENEFTNNEFAFEYIRLVRALVPAIPDKTINTERLMSASTNILKGMMRQMEKKGIKFKFGSSQECADEAFTLIIDLFDNPYVSRLFSNVYELTIKCQFCSKNVSQIRDKSYKINLFNERILDSAEMFSTYIRIHPSELDYYKCEFCKQVMIKTHRIEKLKMLREIVVITFNKFYSKSERWFPETLEFASKNGSVLRYGIVGQIEHGGTMNGGHYYSIAMRDNVYRFNDSSVSNSRFLPTPLTYMVVYHLLSE